MEQRTSEWHAERGVRITASRLVDVLAKSNTKRHKNYLRQIQDNLEGLPDFSTIIDRPWFEHGIEWEDEARGLYEFVTDQNVVLKGIIIHPRYDFISCSPDGLVADEGMLEIKCHKSYREYEKIKWLPAKHKPQVQGQMWISDREWCDFMAYWRNEEGTELDYKIYRVEADKEYHQMLEEKCLEFWEKVNEPRHA